mmetsp:Transcript_75096/g.87189  ORF Transcript_75096/g.87189 Transcript_75096/m.87189 type:complete len:156 (-) Transcript_75096:189-656(-)
MSVAGGTSVSEENELPFLARALNHILTPGSSLTSSVWTAFNIIMLWLFVCWLLFVFSFPYNIHVWAFGILGLGLLLATNWFLSEIFKAGLDFDSQEKKRKSKEVTEKGGQKSVAAASKKNKASKDESEKENRIIHSNDAKKKKTEDGSKKVHSKK